MPGLALLHEVGPDLADQRILVAGAAGAADPADQLTAFDEREAAGARRQRGIEGCDIGVARLKGIEEQPGLAAEARRGARLLDRDITGRDLRTVHPLEQ